MKMIVQISKVLFKIPHKISYLSIERCVLLYYDVKT